MESSITVTHRVNLRMGEGLLFFVVFVNLLFIIILGYDMWKPILFYRDERILLSLFTIFLVLSVLLYFLDTAIWRVFGVELVEINSHEFLYVKKNRLIMRKSHIQLGDIKSINKNVDSCSSFLFNTEDAKGRIEIIFKRKFFCFRYIDRIDVGSQLTDGEIDKVLSFYLHFKAEESF